MVNKTIYRQRLSLPIIKKGSGKMKKRKVILLLLVLVFTVNTIRVLADNSQYYDFTENLSLEEAEKEVTRGEFSHYLSNLLNKKGIYEKVYYEEFAPFNDVGVEHKYYKEIMHLKKLYVVNGVSNDDFNPNSNITYTDAAVMLSRLFLSDEDITNDYGAYPKGYIEYALYSGVFNGIDADMETDVKLGDLYIMMNNADKSLKIYDMMEKLGCDDYNGKVYIDYYPKEWQGFERKPIATSNGYFRILPSKLLYSYDNKNWNLLYEDTEDGRKYYNIPDYLKGARWEWLYAFVNVRTEVEDKRYYSYDNIEWKEGELPDRLYKEVPIEKNKFILGIERPTSYDEQSGLYFYDYCYESEDYYSKRYGIIASRNKSNILWVSEDTKKWIGIKIPENVLFFEISSERSDAQAVIFDCAVEFTEEEKAFLDNEEKIAKELGQGYDKPEYKTEKYIVRFSDIKELFK